MNIEECEKQLKEADQLRSQLKKLIGEESPGASGHPYEIGMPYQIRTVTYGYTGIVTAVTNSEVVLSDASWIADTGRFEEYARGELPDSAEVEPFPRGSVIIGRGAIIDASVRPNPPRKNPLLLGGGISGDHAPILT